MVGDGESPSSASAAALAAFVDVAATPSVAHEYHTPYRGWDVSHAPARGSVRPLRPNVVFVRGLPRLRLHRLRRHSLRQFSHGEFLFVKPGDQ